MTENIDISDLTLKQLLHFYQDPALSAGQQSANQLATQESRSLGKANNTQEDVKKFSEIINEPSNTPQEINQNLANIVDNLITQIGNQS